MKEKVLRNTQIQKMHEMEEIKRAQERRIDEVSAQKGENSRDNSAGHFSIAANARTDEFYE